MGYYANCPSENMLVKRGLEKCIATTYSLNTIFRSVFEYRGNKSFKELCWLGDIVSVEKFLKPKIYLLATKRKGRNNAIGADSGC